MSTAPSDSVRQLDEAAFIWLMYLLVCIDQLDTGVWGYSIENQELVYGDRHDPGSISVSVNCALAIAESTFGRFASQVSRLRSYLIGRRSANGAFGMRRSMGSPDYPSIEILEHSRHTAAAIRFFAVFDSRSHPYVAEGMRYLLNRRFRTPGGLWVDYGSATDGRVDPITVSAVVECLEQALTVGESNLTLNEQDSKEAGAAIEMGLDYLFKSAFRTREGMWLYRFTSEQERVRNEGNAYRYSMGVVAAIVRSCQRTGCGLAGLEKMQIYMRNIFRGYGGYIPNSAYSRDPSISASLNFIRFSERMGGSAALEAGDIRSFTEICKTTWAISSNFAPGWAAILSFFCGKSAARRLAVEEERILERIGRELKPEFLSSLQNRQMDRFVGAAINSILAGRASFSTNSGSTVLRRHRAGKPKNGEALKILFLAANPSKTSRLDLEEELRSFEQELRGVKYREWISVATGHAVQPDDLVRLVRKERPNVIHFSGHGSTKGIVLRNDTGGFVTVDGNNLRRFLEGRGIELVVLNACYSSGQGKSILPAVEAVVGTTDAVGDEAARRFTGAFYRSLGDGLSVGEAFRDGCDAVALHGLSDVFYSAGALDHCLVGAGVRS